MVVVAPIALEDSGRAELVCSEVSLVEAPVPVNGMLTLRLEPDGTDKVKPLCTAESEARLVDADAELEVTVLSMMVERPTVIEPKESELLLVVVAVSVLVGLLELAVGDTSVDGVT